MSETVDKERNKSRKIACAALNHFAAKGYEGASVLEIARTVGMGKSTLYSYFSSKEELFVAAVREWADGYFRTVRARIEAIDDPVEKLQAIAGYTAEIVVDRDPVFLRMSVEFLRQGMIDGGILRRQPKFLMEQVFKEPKIVEQIILDGIARGIFRPEIARDAAVIALNFSSFLDGIAIRTVLLGAMVDAREHITFYMRQVIDFCLSHPTTPGTFTQ